MFDSLYNIQFSKTRNEIRNLTLFVAANTPDSTDAMYVVRNVQRKIEIDHMASLVVEDNKENFKNRNSPYSAQAFRIPLWCPIRDSQHPLSTEHELDRFEIYQTALFEFASSCLRLG